ncbi:MAG: hypothetical protein B6229_00080 [Spirochaetaceae bacterium 4572_7]|nr:MAG: hypothetical protein B6229_00080 [Spirochaetaceae bacterium 4572_7]
MHIFAGIIISSILSLLMWGLSTFYNSNSDNLFSLTVTTFLSSVSPLFLLLIMNSFFSFTHKPEKKQSISFIFGFIYWNLLFSLVLDTRILSSFKLFTQPISAAIVLYVIYSMNFIKFKKNDSIIKGFIYFILPFYSLLIPILTSLSILEVSIALIIPILFIVFLRINLGGFRSKILIDTRG